MEKISTVGMLADQQPLLLAHWLLYTHIKYMSLYSECVTCGKANQHFTSVEKEYDTKNTD